MVRVFPIAALSGKLCTGLSIFAKAADGPGGRRLAAKNALLIFEP
jgi:hypothetical protein